MKYCITFFFFMCLASAFFKNSFVDCDCWGSSLGALLGECCYFLVVFFNFLYLRLGRRFKGPIGT